MFKYYISVSVAEILKTDPELFCTVTAEKKKLFLFAELVG